jgi:hypothetical protein
MSFIDYLKYSGASVTMTVNPWHWAWIPVYRYGSAEIWDYSKTYTISFLFLTIRIWFDDGNW